MDSMEVDAVGPRTASGAELNIPIWRKNRRNAVGDFPVRGCGV